MVPRRSSRSLSRHTASRLRRYTGRNSTMAKYLISFPSAAMVVPHGEWEAVGREAHAVIDQAKAAGVYVFGGGIDEAVKPVRFRPTARSSKGATRGRAPSTAASPCSSCPRVRTPLRGLRVSQERAGVTRSCAFSSSIRSAKAMSPIGVTVPPFLQPSVSGSPHACWLVRWVRQVPGLGIAASWRRPGPAVGHAARRRITPGGRRSA